MTQGRANSRDSPLLSHSSAPLARMAGAPVPQLGGFPDSTQLAWLILGQASNWVIQSGNIQAKRSCALLIHSCAFGGHQSTKDWNLWHYASLLPKPRVENASHVFAGWLPCHEVVQTMNVLIPMHLEMGSGWQSLWWKWANFHQLVDELREQNNSISPGSILAAIPKSLIPSSGPFYEDWCSSQRH